MQLRGFHNNNSDLIDTPETTDIVSKIGLLRYFDITKPYIKSSLNSIKFQCSIFSIKPQR